MTRGRRVATLAMAGLVAVLALLWLDRGSMQRGNRLFADGELDAAERLYRAAADRRAEPSAARFNLGTALLAKGDTAAERHLRQAAGSPDSTIAQQASYNLGFALLSWVDPSVEPDSAIQLLGASVAESRTALRLDPADEDARWNLALAQRMLDSLTMVRSESDRLRDAGDDPTRLEDQALTRSGSGIGVSGQEPDNPQSGTSTGPRQGATVGTREAWALADPGPLTEAAARALLAGLSDNPESLIRGMIWAHRPDVAWWNAERYPGGDW